VLLVFVEVSAASGDDASTSGLGAEPCGSVVSTASVEGMGSVEWLLHALTKSA